MSNEKREQQMMDAADRYADEVCDESCTGAQVAETINDFCAGWRAADQHPQWIPVEERLPEHCYCLLYTEPRNIHGPFEGRFRFGFYNYADQRWEIQGEKWDNTIVTHWMEIVPPRKEDKQ